MSAWRGRPKRRGVNSDRGHQNQLRKTEFSSVEEEDWDKDEQPSNFQQNQSNIRPHWDKNLLQDYDEGNTTKSQNSCRSSQHAAAAAPPPPPAEDWDCYSDNDHGSYGNREVKSMTWTRSSYRGSRPQEDNWQEADHGTESGDRCEERRTSQQKSGGQDSFSHQGKYSQGKTLNRNNFKSFEQEVSVEISSRLVGLIIGKGGSKIRELQEKSNTKINVDKNHINSNGLVSVKIIGNSSDQSMAKRLIGELIDSDSLRTNMPQLCMSESPSVSQVTESRTIEVPSQSVGKIIGKGGSMIRDLQIASDARIQVARDSSNLTTVVTLTGTKEATERAEKLINDRICDFGLGNYRNNSKDEENTYETSYVSNRADWSDDKDRVSDATGSWWSDNGKCSKNYASRCNDSGQALLDTKKKKVPTATLH